MTCKVHSNMLKLILHSITTLTLKNTSTSKCRQTLSISTVGTPLQRTLQTRLRFQCECTNSNILWVNPSLPGGPPTNSNQSIQMQYRERKCYEYHVLRKKLTEINLSIIRQMRLNKQFNLPSLQRFPEYLLPGFPFLWKLPERVRAGHFHILDPFFTCWRRIKRIENRNLLLAGFQGGFASPRSRHCGWRKGQESRLPDGQWLHFRCLWVAELELEWSPWEKIGYTGVANKDRAVTVWRDDPTTIFNGLVVLGSKMGDFECRVGRIFGFFERRRVFGDGNGRWRRRRRRRGSSWVLSEWKRREEVETWRWQWSHNRHVLSLQGIRLQRNGEVFLGFCYLLLRPAEWKIESEPR